MVAGQYRQGDGRDSLGGGDTIIYCEGSRAREAGAVILLHFGAPGLANLPPDDRPHRLDRISSGARDLVIFRGFRLSTA